MRCDACPACGSPSLRPLPGPRLPTLGVVPWCSDYALRVCRACGLWCKDIVPEKGELEAYYRGISVEGSAWNYPAHLPHERRLDALLGAVPDGGAVLDVGCWTGRLLAQHAGRLHACGIEPNPHAAELARAAGVEVLGSRVDDLDATRRFDLILLLDVFEHLSNPVGMLRRLRTALAQQGVLAIVTGRSDCAPVRLAGATYWYFGCADHLVFLNRRFARGLEKMIPDVAVSFEPVRHFDFAWGQFGFEAAWLAAWRWLSPHSPFPKPPWHRLPGLSRLGRLERPVMCGMWRDHALVTLRSR